MPAAEFGKSESPLSSRVPRKGEKRETEERARTREKGPAQSRGVEKRGGGVPPTKKKGKEIPPPTTAKKFRPRPCVAFNNAEPARKWGKVEKRARRPHFRAVIDDIK